MLTPAIEIVSDQNNLCGEGPLWDEKTNCVFWVDVEKALVFKHRITDHHTSIISRDLPVSGLAMNHDGRLVIAGARGIYLLSEDGVVTTVLKSADNGDYCFNDLVAAPDGRLYAGTFHWEDITMLRPGYLYLIDGNASVRVVDDGIQLSNGLGFSPGNRILYYADSVARKIYAYDVADKTGDLSNKHVFFDIPIEDGLPDGLTVDADGFVWCATWYGGQVLRIDPDGSVERCIKMPVKQTSSVTFGGPDLTDLYVTTAGQFWNGPFLPPGFDGRAPMGGAIYRVRLSIKGKAEHCCAFGG